MQAPAETAMTLCQQHGYSARLSHSMILAGWALVQQEQAAEGMAQIQAGFAIRHTQLHMSSYMALLAEAYGQIGQPAQGVRVVDETLAMVAATEARFVEAELYRLKGELLQMQGAAGDASEACLQHAIDIARQQNAKSLELRAAMSLARLWRTQGKRTEAHQLLSPIYAWFTEGFDTLDLQEARTLLEELA